MGKYTDCKKTGLVIGWDNVYSYRVPEGGLKSFRAIVWARDYNFERMSTANVFIHTPAQQFIWAETMGGFELRYYIRSWLQLNAGRWGIRPQTSMERVSQPIFFEKVKHARAFAEEVRNNLKCNGYL